MEIWKFIGSGIEDFSAQLLHKLNHLKIGKNWNNNLQVYSFRDYRDFFDSFVTSIT